MWLKEVRKKTKQERAISHEGDSFIRWKEWYLSEGSARRADWKDVMAVDGSPVLTWARPRRSQAHLALKEKHRWAVVLWHVFDTHSSSPPPHLLLTCNHHHPSTQSRRMFNPKKKKAKPSLQSHKINFICIIMNTNFKINSNRKETDAKYL